MEKYRTVSGIHQIDGIRSKHIRKTPLFLIMLICAILLTSCTQNADKKPTESILYNQGLEMALAIKDAASSHEYVKIYGVDVALYPYVESAGAGYYATPEAVYSISIQNIREFMREELLLEEEIDIQNLSENVVSLIEKRYFSSLCSTISSEEGMYPQVASSICTYTKAFVADGLSESILYLYTYQNSLPVMIVFMPDDDGAVLAVGSVLYCPEIDTSSAAAVAEFFGDFDVYVTEVENN